MKKYLAYILIVCTLLACGREEKKSVAPEQPDEDIIAEFVTLEEIGVYGSDLAPRLLFDKMAHELVYNATFGRMSMHNDALETLLSITLSNEGDDLYSVDVNASATGISEFCLMKLVKTEDDLAWLWDTENNLGIIMLKQ